MIKFLACLKPPVWLERFWIRQRLAAMSDDLIAARARRAEAEITVASMSGYIEAAEARYRALSARAGLLEPADSMLRRVLSNRSTR